MPDTLAYYESNADRYAASSMEVDMSPLHERFLAHVPAGGWLLDAGCGAGRDSKAFLDGGFRVRAFDASLELAKHASHIIGQVVPVMRFSEFDEHQAYNGIWACASLLHVPERELPGVLARLWRGLKPGGVLYVSFKHGGGERIDGGRCFTDANETRLRDWLDALPDVARTDHWMSDDRHHERNQVWLNALIFRAPKRDKLITGERQNPFLPRLRRAIVHANEIDFAVAFIKSTGLRLLLPALKSSLGLDEEAPTPGPARVRIVTSDYLDITDPEALRLLMLLQERGASVRVFEAGSTSFHMKAYVFARVGADRSIQGTAFIGSSNISRQALTDGLEWNYRIDYPDDDGFLEARTGFEALFRDPRTVALSDAWIDAYEARRIPPVRTLAPGSGETEPAPEPTPIQNEALASLAANRAHGFRRGLVVLATGLGKTWLAAFDAEQAGAKRVLFVAHREEILNQAAETFVRIRPRARVGFYKGQTRDTEVDVLCASVQTLGRDTHLERFAPSYFDYIVVDEFHHAAAPTYRRLMAHFEPHFLLGLTATPERSDQSDILSLCDDNLVFTCNLFAGVEANALAPFHYYGIWDESVDYRDIPWRNRRFDPELLSSKLATLARARHALSEWRARAQKRTVAFCMSIRHAEFMSEQFRREGVRAVAVFSGSALSRGEALEQLDAGTQQVIFSVDLFNEGVDLPSIDTVLMLRPTESKILFLQQLGRGLRKHDDKEQLVVLDFIGNHHSFLHKTQALGQTGASYKQLVEFARKVETQRLALPEGCYINYDLALIDFLKSLDSDGTAREYTALRHGLDRRPTLAEFYRGGANLPRMRQEYGSWFQLVREMGDLDANEQIVVDAHRGFLREVETTEMSKSYKMVMLEALQELDGWSAAPRLDALAARSWNVLQRRRALLGDLPDSQRNHTDGTSATWQSYWRGNPIKAWTGRNRSADARPWFRLANERFEATFAIAFEQRESFSDLVQELIDQRLAAYEARRSAERGSDNVIPFQRSAHSGTELPYFPNLKIACGHFRSARADAEEHRTLGSGYGRLNPGRHFIAHASGNSMNGGKNPIRDGDYLLLELLSPSNAGSITGTTMAIERLDQSGDEQYLLRVVTKNRDGSYVLVANNPDYEDIVITPEMATGLRTLAKLKEIIDPLEVAVGEAFMREDIPPLFGETFTPGNWNSGHVVIPDRNAHVLLVTLNKQGKAADHRYLDHWIDERTFHWQSQNQTTPHSKRGREIIEHKRREISLHLFVRETKLVAGAAAPFIYYGPVKYLRHSGSAPMSVVLEIGY